MIKFENRFDEYAYRVSSLPLAATAKVEEGQWVTIKDGEVVLANGTTDKKAFLAIGSNREGRDQVAGRIVRKISFLVGDFMLTVSNFDTGKSYSSMSPLKVNETGNLTLSESPGTDTVVAYALGAPVNGFLRIVSA